MRLFSSFALALTLATVCASANADTVATGELRFHGSNTIGAALAPRLIEAYLKQRGATFGDWQTLTEDVEVAGESKPEQYRVLDVTNAPAGVPSRIYVRPYGSGTAFKALQAGTAEVGMSSRPIKAEEVAELASIGNMTVARNEHVIALDGLAVLVHQSNPLSSLTLEQVRRIFACELRNWSEVGGRPGAIRLYARDANSGTWDTFKSLVLDGPKPAKGLCQSPPPQRYEDSKRLVADVANDPNGIGFVGMAYVGGQAGVKALKLDQGWLSVGPSDFAVKAEEYPLSRKLYLYTPETKSEFVQGFLEFVKGEVGQQVVSGAGAGDQADRFVDLRIGDSGSKEAKEHRLATCRAAAIEVQDPKTLGQLMKDTQGADRLSTTFRFKTGRFDLEARSEDDVPRVVKFMNRPENQGRKLLLLGFADSKGDYQANCKLSGQRADTVATALRNQGLSPALVKGYCEEAPVAQDDPQAKEGDPKNRRVEVWVR